MDEGLLAGFIFVFGLLIGSFLNVCIWRLPREESIIWPASHCPACSTVLGVRDLVPVLSWIFLRGKCRYCGERISPRYPAVELLTGALFLACFQHYGLTLELAAALLLSALLVAIAFIDIDHQIILDGMLIVLGAVGLVLQLWTGAVGFLSMLAGALAGGGLLLLLAIVSRGGMGGGDVKFAALIGLVLGWHGWQALVVGAAAAFVLGAVHALGLIVLRRATGSTHIAFGPWMIMGGALGVAVV